MSPKRLLADETAVKGPGRKKRRKINKDAEKEVRSESGCSHGRSQFSSKIIYEHLQVDSSEETSKKQRRRKNTEQDVMETKKQRKKSADLTGSSSCLW